jgi:hypothetical protein
MAFLVCVRVWLRTPRNRQLAVAIVSVLWVTTVVLTAGTVTVYDMRGNSREIVTEGSALRIIVFSLPMLLALGVMFWWFGPNLRAEQFSLMGNSRHEIGNPKCPQCLYGITLKCKCGGFRHVEFVREVFDEDKNDQIYQNATKCDRCGRETWPDEEMAQAG